MKSIPKTHIQNTDDQLSQNPKISDASATHGFDTYRSQNFIAGSSEGCVAHQHSCHDHRITDPPAPVASIFGSRRLKRAITDRLLKHANSPTEPVMPPQKRQKQVSSCCLGAADGAVSSDVGSSLDPPSQTPVTAPQTSFVHNVPEGSSASTTSKSLTVNGKRCLQKGKDQSKRASEVATSQVHQRCSTTDLQSNLRNSMDAADAQEDTHTNQRPRNNTRNSCTTRKRNRSNTNLNTRHVRQRRSTNSLQCHSGDAGESTSHTTTGASPVYDDLGDCNQRCQYCNAAFCHFENSDTPGLDPEVVQGLIHFLDAHNELVQVFRTARDKCAEANVPEFKVSLYNGEGARRYELPTSQALGAIVFQDGPQTETDYDVIIEYRDAPPKRINKLHQSYMSLQFPLIFIYAIEPKPDGPTSEAPATLLALTDHNNEGQKTDEENKPQAVKRALFQDEQPSVKKQKATTESSAPEKTKTKGSENKKQG
ncbi:helitron helicase-like domain-containing protein [Artemisia annua]|uniref:Helitron helicase-like domain-containing protein n=1 Tax=Artemisia annua TaxID=35608 RepID=A0A2U1NS71_ARTAN|nr:helitron helicase-like domain-containing protein [Artemisia annua]